MEHTIGQKDYINRMGNAMEGENDKHLPLLKNIPGSENDKAEKITERMANDTVNELIEKYMVEHLTEKEITKGRD